jgi:hypothetical protein
MERITEQSINTFMKYCLIVFAAFCLLLCLSECSENSSKEQEIRSSDTANSKSGISPLEGAWELVWEDIGGKIRSIGKPTQIKLFTHGFFSYLMQDSTGKWNYAGAGTYEVDGNTYKEKHLYCTVPEYVGATDWQEFEMQGDTLIFKLFTKVINAKGEDITNQWPKIIEKRVRAKK